MSDLIRVKCAFQKLVPLENLAPNPKNTNKHSEKQVNLLANIISYQGIRHPIIVSKRSGFIVAGHCRLESAKRLGLESFPVDFQDFENEGQEYLFLESDNHIAELADHDRKKMLENLEEIKIENLDLLGLPEFTTDNLKMFDEDETSNDLIDENKSKEIDVDSFGNDLSSTCPRCNFEF